MTTATSAFVIFSPQYGGLEVLSGTSDNIDGTNVLTFTLPVGYGDCLLLSCGIWVANIATLATPGDALGFEIWSVGVQSTRDVLIGAGKFAQSGTARVGGHAEVRQPVLIAGSGAVQVLTPEVDTNATPTGDFGIRALVLRLRDVTLSGLFVESPYVGIDS